MINAALTRELVLVGGGHAHVLVLRRWGMAPLPGARLTLIDPGPVTAYTGMLPGFVAGHYAKTEIEIDLVRLARFAGARLILGRVTGIDRERRQILTDTGRRIAYDVASLDIGITSDMPDLPGFAEHGAPAKPLDRLAVRWAEFVAAEGPAEVTVIGGGVGGVELAMAMAHALRARGRLPTVRVVDRGEVLHDLPAAARTRLLGELRGQDIPVLPGTVVRSVQARTVTLGDGRTLPSTLTIGAAGARAWPWLEGTGLALTRGFVDVGPTLATSDARIFAAGDCAHLSFAPRLKAGVFAVRAAPILARNLRAALSGGSPRPFRPQRDYLKLVSLGRKSALATKWGAAWSAPWVWRWKDRIDRRFMERLSELPAMRVARPVPRALGEDGETPLCGGCGSKVGSATLARALAFLPDLGRGDVTLLPGDDAALLTHDGVRQVVSTDHLRAFTADPWLLARITAMHAMGDVWAMGGAPQAALLSVILPRLSERMQEDWLAEIVQAAAGAFGPEGAQIVGGHTTMGAELTIGFTVSGLLDQAPVTRAGALPGDALILTRPLGSGTLLAAEMAMRAPGPAVTAALVTMARPQGDAARRLSAAHAMTDVTGFGLAGHLLGICAASAVAADLWLDAVPLYDGALALSQDGVRSALYAANRAAAATAMELPDDPRAPLLFDPQTAGGLLAAVAAGKADRLVEDLRALGHDAARIGTIRDGAPRIIVR